MVEILGLEVQVELLQTVVELVPRMRTAQVLPQMLLELTVEVVVVQLKMYPSEMVDLQQLHPVQTEWVMETQEVKEAQVVELNLAAAAAARVVRVAILELQSVEMVAVERMLSRFG
jgi:hypothetical protein